MPYQIGVVTRVPELGEEGNEALYVTSAKAPTLCPVFRLGEILLFSVHEDRETFAVDERTIDGRKPSKWDVAVSWHQTAEEAFAEAHRVIRERDERERTQ